MKNLHNYWNFYIGIFIAFIFIKPAISFLILGLMIVLQGVDFYMFFKNIENYGVCTEGKIILYESDSDGHKQPVVRYKTKEGETFEVKPFYYATTDVSIFRSYKDEIGKVVTVIYDKKIPKRMIIENETIFNYLSLILMFLVGFVFCLVSILNLLGYIKIDS